MVESVQEALGRLGIGDAIGGVAGDVGVVAGAMGGQRASDAASGLPELIDETTSSRVELEGERLPGFHVSDVIDALRS